EEVEVAGGQGHRPRGDLLAHPFEQRDGELIAFAPEALRIALGELQTALDGSAPRDQGGRRPGDDRDPRERPTSRRREDYAAERGQPKEGVPLRPCAVG